MKARWKGTDMRHSKGTKGQLAIEALVYLLLTGVFLMYGFFVVSQMKPIEFGKWRLASSIADTLVMNPDFGWVGEDHGLVEGKIGKKLAVEFGYKIGETMVARATAEACLWRIAAKDEKPIWIEVCV